MAKEISFAVRDRLFRMAKRSTLPWHRAWLIRLIAVSCSLIVCALIIVAITKQNPIDIYLGIIDGAVGKSRRIWATVRETLVLLIIAIGLTPAFKMRFWNIGAEGQLLMGGAAGAAVMIYLTGIVPGWMVLILVFVASILAGMLWGLLPAVFKAYFHTNETLFTLMMNYVAIQIVTVCIVFWENPPGSNFVGVINSDSEIGWLPKLFGLSYGWNLILVLSVTIGMFIYMKYSKQGYEIAVVGESSHTARYAGINIKKVIIRTMLISGGICGFAGAAIPYPPPSETAEALPPLSLRGWQNSTRSL